MKACFVSIVVLLCICPGSARDIDLDSIYVSTKSFYYPKLAEKKIEAYEKVNSRYVDSDVIFAHWLTGFELVYIKEVAGTNTVYFYDRIKKTRTEVVRMQGIITASKLLFNSRLLVIKKMTIVNNRPKGEMLVVDIQKKTWKGLKRRSSFLDFSVSPGDNTLLVHNNKGIVEYDPASGSMELLVTAKQYADIRNPGNPTIAFMAPNRRSKLVINGSGGNYRSKLARDKNSWLLAGISSVAEIFWLDNDSFVYRKGSPGYFSVTVYDAKTRTDRVLLRNSYNTNICYSKYPKILAYLKDQVVYVYYVREKSLLRTGLEGEDVYFSPDGTWFTSLFRKKLFITNIYVLKKKRHMLRSTFRDLFDLYKKLSVTKRDWNNEYSREYIKRKIALYESLL